MESLVQMVNFRFEKERHKYFLGDKEIPGVNAILKAAGKIDDTWFDDVSAARGSGVHLAIFYDLMNDLHMDSLHPILVPYVQAWIGFKKVVKFSPIIELCEKPQYHPIHRYGGTPDFVGKMNGRNALIDIDTGASTWKHWQTAAYSEFPEIKKLFPERFRLQLRKDGQFRLHRFSSSKDFFDFILFNKSVKLNSQQP